jgi:hypothetical protein
MALVPVDGSSSILSNNSTVVRLHVMKSSMVHFFLVVVAAAAALAAAVLLVCVVVDPPFTLSYSVTGNKRRDLSSVLRYMEVCFVNNLPNVSLSKSAGKKKKYKSTHPKVRKENQKKMQCESAYY